MKVRSLDELPEFATCLKCDKEKPVVEMVVVRLRKQHLIYVRPRCKVCHNKFERGRRRDYKTKYLRRWRKWHAELNESYWRQRNAEKRPELNAQSYRRFQEHHAAILIQGRLRRRLGMKVSLVEAEGFARKYGVCYPSRFGLTPLGLKECERIRSNMRRMGKWLHPVEIRMMVYADGHFKKPRLQKMPYAQASRRLASWHERKKAA